MASRPSRNGRGSGAGGRERGANDTSMYYASDSGDDAGSMSSDEDGFVGWGPPRPGSRHPRGGGGGGGQGLDATGGGGDGGPSPSGRSGAARGGEEGGDSGSAYSGHTSTTNRLASRDDDSEQHPEGRSASSASHRSSSRQQHLRDGGSSPASGAAGFRRVSDAGSHSGSVASARPASHRSAGAGPAAFSSSSSSGPFGGGGNGSDAVGIGSGGAIGVGAPSSLPSASASSSPPPSPAHSPLAAVSSRTSALATARAAVREGGKAGAMTSFESSMVSSGGGHVETVAGRTRTPKSFVPAGSFRVSKSGGTYVKPQEDIRAKFKGGGITEEVMSGTGGGGGLSGAGGTNLGGGSGHNMAEEDDYDEVGGVSGGRGRGRGRGRASGVGRGGDRDAGARLSRSSSEAGDDAEVDSSAAGRGGGRISAGGGGGGGASKTLVGLNRRARSRSPSRRIVSNVKSAHDVAIARRREARRSSDDRGRESDDGNHSNINNNNNNEAGVGRQGQGQDSRKVGSDFETPLKRDAAPGGAAEAGSSRRESGDGTRLAGLSSSAAAGGGGGGGGGAVASPSAPAGASAAAGSGVGASDPKSMATRRKSNEFMSAFAQQMVPEENKIKSAAAMIMAAQRAQMLKIALKGDGGDGADGEHKCEVRGSDSSTVATETSFEITDFSSDDDGGTRGGFASSVEGEEDDDDGAAVRIWSVRVRLISAVDLPSNLTPNTPLCPLLKFGIITSSNVGDVPKEPDAYGGAGASVGPGVGIGVGVGVGVGMGVSMTGMGSGGGPGSVGGYLSGSSGHGGYDRSDDDDGDSSTGRRRGGPGGGSSGEDADGSDEDSGDFVDDGGDDESGNSSDGASGGGGGGGRRHRRRRKRKGRKKKKKKKRRETVLARLHSRGLTSIPKSRVRCSSGKILSPRDNGSMEWHEEMRWDGIKRPLQTILAVELCARAILPPPPAPLPPSSPAPSSSSLGTAGGLAGQGSSATPSLVDEGGSVGLAGAGGGSGGGSAHGPGTAAAMDESVHGGRSVGGGSDVSGPQVGASSNSFGLLGSLGGQQHQDDASTSSGQQQQQQQQQQQGLRGLWRRGRQIAAQAQAAQQQQHSRGPAGGPPPQNIAQRGTSAGDDMEKASAAAAVAKYITGDRPQEPYPPPPRASFGTSGGAMSGVGSQRTPGDSRRWGGVDDPLGGLESSTMEAVAAAASVSSPAASSAESVGMKHDRAPGAEAADGADAGADYDPDRPRKKPRCSQMVEDLRLGTLIIPLSRLPLEDATSSPNGEAVVERWYQLDTSAVSGGRDLSSHPAAKKALSPRRCPSVLLEISFCTAQTLDDSEDEADNEGAGEVNWDGNGGDDPNAAEGGGEGAASGGTALRRSSLSSNVSDGDDKQRRSAVVVPAAELVTPDTPAVSKKKAKELAAAAAKAQEELDIRRDGPVLKPGVVDYIAVVGARDIGNQQNDDGAKGWVQSTPECCVLERFPPTDEFHLKNGRKIALPDKVEWFCFPEGCKLWRGSEPPHSSDLNLKRFSASSPPTMASSIAAFDACLNCTTSLTWFVLASNSDDYGSRCVKTYGIVIRFYAPAPSGIDRTQDDFAQMIMGGETPGSNSSSGKLYETSRAGGGTSADSNSKRLWVPLGILMTTQHPIVGTIEAMLLRICETLASRANSPNSISSRWIWSVVHNDLANLIMNFQAPIPGVLHTSIPFLSGERLHLTLPPRTGLPPLPHGASVTSVCRLLGAEGLTVLLAAVLTECKILVHSLDVANLAMVAEVITALTYPFIWALPYIPVLPEAMMEFIEAPLSYFLGVPTCNMQFIDKSTLHDVVVIDLDNGFSSPDYFDGTRGRGMRATKVPTPLPASVSSNISKAVFKLLKEEEEVEEQYGAAAFSCGRHLPRLECESLAEREFRIAVALQVCSLVRGYQECLFFVSASQPVFNRDRFLRNAPALFEERRGNIQALSLPNSGVGGQGGSHSGGPSQRILSPRSKRFLSNLVNTQHFHGLLESLDSDDAAFFHEVMDTFDRNDSDSGGHSSGGGLASGMGSALSGAQLAEALSHLSAALEKVEQKIPTYRVDRDPAKSNKDNGKPRRGSFFLDEDEDPDGMDGFEEMMEAHEEADVHCDPLGYDMDDGSFMTTFTHDLLKPILMSDIKGTKEHEAESVRRSSFGEDSESSGPEGVHSVSLEYLVQLEKQPWKYCRLFEIPTTEEEEGEKADSDGEESKDQQHIRPTLMQVGSWRGKCPSEDQFKVKLKLWQKVRLKEAIGERRFRAWKLAQERKMYTSEDSMRMSTTNINKDEKDNALDLTSLLSSVGDDAGLNDAAGGGGGANSGALANARAGGPNSTMSLEQQRTHDARDRDVLRRCLERAYEGTQTRTSRYTRRSSIGQNSVQGGAGSSSFQENGVDLITEAEAALRNPSAQRFLVSVLSQRTRLENQRRRRHGGGGGGAGFGGQNDIGERHRQSSNQSSVSRLKTSAFECLVRLSIAMLQACMEGQDYESAYQLLTHTAGFCTVVPSNTSAAAAPTETTAGIEGGSKDKSDQNTKIMYMTARIGQHPIFADLRLWERVMELHLHDRQRDRSANKDAGNVVDVEDKDKESKPGEGEGELDDEADQYEAAVSTLYEMLGYGVPAEDLAKFATRIADVRSWFGTERGQALLMLARRLSVKRDDGEAIEGGPGSAGNLDLMATKGEGVDVVGKSDEENNDTKKAAGGGLCVCDERKHTEWHEVAWSHPAADTSASAGGRPGLNSFRGASPRSTRAGGYASLSAGGSSVTSFSPNISGVPSRFDGAHTVVLRLQRGSDSDVLEPVGSASGAGRTAVTSLASFGANVVASGGLDGSVFLAHTIRFGSIKSTDKEKASGAVVQPLVCGVRLEWGNAGSRGIGVGSTSSAIDGEFGVGAVSCLAAARGAGYHHAIGGSGSGSSNESRGVDDLVDEEELLAAMEGCRVVAGTTGGDLRVWSVKDVYATTIVAGSRDGGDGTAAADALGTSMADMRINHGAGGANSAYLRSSAMGGRADASGPASSARSKFPLRGRALSGHRGGVTCVDVPSHVYRPDSLVSGGADGLIKLWSLRQQAPGRRPSSVTPTAGGVAGRHAQATGRAYSGRQGSSRNLPGGDSTGAAGYRGRHSLGTEPLETLTGHGGRVLCIKTAWHGDRLLSGGADRTVRLWDLAGSGGKCLHTLHGHLGWVTQCHYWGPHTVVSASTDRSIALWDARVGASPLFVLRYHRSPVSDLLVGSRTDFLMVSAGGDGICATWDFRKLSGAGGDSKSSQPAASTQSGGTTGSAIARQAGGGGSRQNQTRTVRDPVATMDHCREGSPRVKCSGTVLLGRGAGLQERPTVLSVAVDGRMKEWETASGRLLYRRSVGHTDAVSCLSTFFGSDSLIRGKVGAGISDSDSSGVGGNITCSWDGTVRLRRLAMKPQ